MKVAETDTVALKVYHCIITNLKNRKELDPRGNENDLKYIKRESQKEFQKEKRGWNVKFIDVHKFTDLRNCEHKKDKYKKNYTEGHSSSSSELNPS